MTSQPRHSEAAFETVIEAHLLQSGYVRVAREGFDRERAIFPETVIAFIRETQPNEWAKLEALHGEKTGEQILGDLCKWMDQNGSLATLRNGFKCYGRTLREAFFKAVHELNPELEARYAANRLGLTRQLHFSPRSGKSLDVTLSLNGIPVATVELKNPLTGQRVEDARRQYKQDRDPREPSAWALRTACLWRKGAAGWQLARPIGDGEDGRPGRHRAGLEGLVAATGGRQ